MKFAYADPPYPGCAHRYAAEAAADGRVAAEVDHGELVTRLSADHDAWALSTSATALRAILNLCPDDVRVAVWAKTWVSFKKGVNPAYAWEPVIFRGARRWKERGGSEAMTVRDWLACTPQQDGFFGAKPETFSFWLFDLIGARPDDEFADLFPGSGAVTRAWDKWKRQTRLIA